MKRDFDLVRLILLAIEAADQISSEEVYNSIGSTTSRKHFDYNFRMMVEDVRIVEGFSVPDTEDLDIEHWVELKLTWKGHDYLDTVRDSQIWEATKTGAKSAGGFTFEILQALAKGLIKTKIEKHTGVTLDL